MSMGFLVDQDAPVVWRGLMVCRYFLKRGLRNPCLGNESSGAIVARGRVGRA